MLAKAKPGTPRAIVMRINQELAAAAHLLPEIQERLIAVGAGAAHTSPEAYAAFPCKGRKRCAGREVLKQVR